ncbi:hypothetical protein OY671_010837, partial [Metschnikowia pulcherrima]
HHPRPRGRARRAGAGTQSQRSGRMVRAAVRLRARPRQPHPQDPPSQRHRARLPRNHVASASHSGPRGPRRARLRARSAGARQLPLCRRRGARHAAGRPGQGHRHGDPAGAAGNHGAAGSGRHPHHSHRHHPRHRHRAAARRR